MKKRINFIKIFITVSALILASTACTKTDKEVETPTNSTNATQVTKINVPTEVATQATENLEIEEVKIVEAIHDKIWDNSDIVTYDSSSDKVDELANRYLGNITSNEDAIEKGKIALEELYQSAENYYSYEAEFYDEYDVWVVNATFPPSYTDADGKQHATLGTVPYIVIRQLDGKVLGTFTG